MCSSDLEIAGNIQAPFGGHLFTFFRNEANLMGFDFAGNGQHGIGTGTLQIESHGDRLFEQSQVPVLDVSAIFAEMDCDLISATQFGSGRGPDGVRLAGAASLANGCDVVDIDSEFRHFGSRGELEGVRGGSGLLRETMIGAGRAARLQVVIAVVGDKSSPI